MTELTIKEVKLLLDRLDEKLDDHTSVHQQILNLVSTVDQKITYTNGKVGELVKWRERVTGAMSVIVLVVVPLLGWALYKISTIQDVVVQTIDNYQIEITP